MQFSPNVTYQLNIDQVEDLSGNLIEQAQKVNFTMDSVADIQRGSFESFTPLNGIRNVPLNTILEFRSNERIDPTTLTANEVYLQNLTKNSRVAGTLALTEEGRLITLIPNKPLIAGHQYRFYFSSTNFLFDLSDPLLKLFFLRIPIPGSIFKALMAWEFYKSG